MLAATAFGEPTGQGWAQIGELAIAFVLSLLIGIEREMRQKSAGVRTYSLVGVVTAVYFVVVLGLRPLTRAVRRLSPDSIGMRVTYLDGRGLLRDIVGRATAHGFAVAQLTTTSVDPVVLDGHHDGDAVHLPTVGVALALSGRGDLAALTSVLSEIDGSSEYGPDPPRPTSELDAGEVIESEGYDRFRIFRRVPGPAPSAGADAVR